MNQLINDIFGDGYISLKCEGGECLHFSQVPGYVVSDKPVTVGTLLRIEFWSATSQTRQYGLDCAEHRWSGRTRPYGVCRYVCSTHDSLQPSMHLIPPP
jgi:hypothetical protein